MIEILTCGATHGYMPLLGTDESVRAQVRIAVSTHTRHLGKRPRGIWVPECGYRPAGFWEYPVAVAAAPTEHARLRTHRRRAGALRVRPGILLRRHAPGRRSPTRSRRPTDPREPSAARPPAGAHDPRAGSATSTSPITSTGPTTSASPPRCFRATPAPACRSGRATPAIPATPTTSTSTRNAFPEAIATGGSPAPGSTSATSWSTGRSRPPSASRSMPATLSRWCMRRSVRLQRAHPAVLCSPFDAELFGHWWFEGPMWLEAVCPQPARATTPASPAITCSQYLDRYPRAGFIAMPEGSWGAEGRHQVWMNPETSWT